MKMIKHVKFVVEPDGKLLAVIYNEISRVGIKMVECLTPGDGYSAVDIDYIEEQCTLATPDKYTQLLAAMNKHPDIKYVPILKRI